LRLVEARRDLHRGGSGLPVDRRLAHALDVLQCLPDGRRAFLAVDAGDGEMEGLRSRWEAPESQERYRQCEERMDEVQAALCRRLGVSMADPQHEASIRSRGRTAQLGAAREGSRV